jgi:hypothetical protein
MLGMLFVELNAQPATVLRTTSFSVKDQLFLRDVLTGTVYSALFHQPTNTPTHVTTFFQLF